MNTWRKVGVCFFTAVAVFVAQASETDYQLIEYLQLPGGRHFVVPYNRSTDKFGYSIKFCMTTSDMYSPHLISTGNISQGSDTYWVAARSSGHSMPISFSLAGNDNGYYAPATAYPEGKDGLNYDLTMSFNTNGTEVAELNGVVVEKTAKGTTAKNSTVSEFVVCGYNKFGGNELRGKFYYAQFYYDGELIAEYRPCVRLADNMPGIYDVIADEFYPPLDGSCNINSSGVICGPDVNTPADALVVRCLPDNEHGVINPGVGMLRGFVAGEERQLTAQMAVTNQEETICDELVGWELYERISPADGPGSWELLAKGSTDICNYKHPSPARLTRLDWIWSRKLAVRATLDESIEEGVTLTPELQWVASGETATITAGLATEKWKVKWSGDVPNEKKFENPLTLLVGDAPKSVCASTVGNACFYSPYPPTDTSWVKIAEKVKPFTLASLHIEAILNTLGTQRPCTACFSTSRETDEGLVVSFQIQKCDADGKYVRGVVGELLLASNGDLSVRMVSAHYPYAGGREEVDFTIDTSNPYILGIGNSGYGFHDLIVYTDPPPLHELTDALYVRSLPGNDYGVTDPVSGELIDITAGRPLTLTAQTAVTNDGGTAESLWCDELLGWRLYRGIESVDMDAHGVLVDEDESSICNYVHPDPAELMRLDWLWVRKRAVFASVADGVEGVTELSPMFQWVGDGSNAVITAKCLSRKWMVVWGGDVPANQITQNPLILPIDGVSKDIYVSKVVGGCFTYLPYPPRDKSWVKIAENVAPFDVDALHISGKVVAYTSEANQRMTRDAYFITQRETADGIVYSFQFQLVDDGYVKGVLGELLLTSEGVLSVRMAGAFYPRGNSVGTIDYTDLNNQYNKMNLCDSNGNSGYGFHDLLIYTDPQSLQGLCIIVK